MVNRLETLVNEEIIVYCSTGWILCMTTPTQEEPARSWFNNFTTLFRMSTLLWRIQDLWKGGRTLGLDQI